MTTKSQSTTTKLEASEPTLEPCPLCRKPLDLHPNGFAVCRNLASSNLEHDEWVAGSCLMAAHGIQMRVEVWQALNTRVSANTVPTVDDAEPQHHAKTCDRWVQCGDHVHYEPIVNCSCAAPAPSAAIQDETPTFRSTKEAMLYAQRHGIPSVIPAKSSYREGVDDAARVTCAWTYDPDGYWETSCGDQFCITEGSPAENRMRYCHYCGLRIVTDTEAGVIDSANG